MPVVIENSRLKVGVDPDRGGAICFLGRGGSGDNLLNAFDCGRFVQQSYYGADDGSDWNGKPWRWNPVQGGSWENRPAQVVACEKASGQKLRTVVHPRNWAGQQLLDDVTMTAGITLQPDHVHLEHTFEYTGGTQHPVRIQELPAVFVVRRLSQLVFYEGDKPWTGGILQSKTPGFPNVDYKMDENWAAWVDPATQEGVGVWVPWCSTMTSYRVGDNDNSCQSCDCSYFAPTIRFAVTPGMKFTYHAFICIGSVDEMRTTFNNIRGWAKGNRPEWLACPIPGAAPALPGRTHPEPGQAPRPTDVPLAQELPMGKCCAIQ
ncbi:MAG: hypothetical protein J3K34DRAFT_411475 [Monoraphidium minutum]|nr:MAG: hypothetical protein J3K34DRAFT_411475 [Monoraphidium minutum]